MATKSRRSYKGAPVSNTLGVALSAGGTTITVASALSGWPTSSEPFFVVIDPGTAKEEKCCVVYSSTTQLTVVDPAATSGWTASSAGRGADDTTDRNHDAGATIYPVFTALEANQANELVSKYSAQGAIVYQGASTFSTLAVGTANQVLKVNSGATAPEWGQVATAGIADSAVTAAKIAAAALKLVCPVGTISAYPGGSAPTGWLLCDGTSISASYTELIALVGSTTPDLRGKVLVGKGSAPFDGTLLTSFGSTTSTAPHTHDINHDHAAFNWTHDHAAFSTSGSDGTHTHTISDPGHVHQINSLPEDATNTGSWYPNSEQTTQPLRATSTESATTGISVTSTNSAHSHTIDVPSHTGSIDIPALGTTASGASSAGATHGNVQPSTIVNFIIKHDYV